jgi:hypothetical protein
VPDQSLGRFVWFVVAEALIVGAAVAGILTWLSPVLGLWAALALVVILVLVAVVAALLLYLKSVRAPADPSKIAAPLAGKSGRYYIERNGMIFAVEMTQREGPSGEPLAGIVGLPLCPVDHAQMVRAGDDTDWTGSVQRRNWRCPNGDSTGFISYLPPDSTLDAVKALAVGRWHNGEPFDPPLSERPRPKPPKPVPTRSLVRPETERRDQESAPADKPSAPTGRRRPAEEQIVSKVVEVRDVSSVRLPVKGSDQVFGTLLEKESLDFSWFIVDLENLGLMERGEDYDYESGEEDVPNATVDWTASSDGPWFLAFDAYRKQYIRNVAVELWRRRP